MTEEEQIPELHLKKNWFKYFTIVLMVGMILILGEFTATYLSCVQHGGQLSQEYGCMIPRQFNNVSDYNVECHLRMADCGYSSCKGGLLYDQR
jgi:hypothetical protein